MRGADIDCGVPVSLVGVPGVHVGEGAAGIGHRLRDLMGAVATQRL